MVVRVVCCLCCVYVSLRGSGGDVDLAVGEPQVERVLVRLQDISLGKADELRLLSNALAAVSNFAIVYDNLTNYEDINQNVEALR